LADLIRQKIENGAGARRRPFATIAADAEMQQLLANPGMNALLV
jgi:hypothetical protein